jgi:hypothetical protein
MNLGRFMGFFRAVSCAFGPSRKRGEEPPLAIDLSILEQRVLYSASPLLQFADGAQNLDLDADFDFTSLEESAVSPIQNLGNETDLEFHSSVELETLLDDSFNETNDGQISGLDALLEASVASTTSAVVPPFSLPSETREFVFVDQSVDNTSNRTASLRSDPVQRSLFLFSYVALTS